MRQMTTTIQATGSQLLNATGQEDARLREDAGLRIGALSKLSGIPSPTLRAWERRYNAFKPFKTQSGQRLYARSDASRAVLIRNLADHGFALQQLSNCDLNELLRLRDSTRRGEQNRAAQHATRPNEPARSDRLEPRQALKALIIGESLALRLLQEKHQTKLQSMDVVLEVAKQPPKPKQLRDSALGLVLIEIVSLLEPDCQSALALKASLGPKSLILCYRFGATHLVALLRNAGIVVYREPVEDEHLIDAMLATRSQTGLHHFSVPTPSPRRYSIAKIRQIAQSMPSTTCECPRYVSEILEQLLAFEDYSEQCLSNGVKDLALHAQLLRFAAIARTQFEDALEAVAKHEDISL